MSGKTGIQRHAALQEARVGILVWRFEQLLRAGFEPRLALAIARDERFDLHEDLALVEADCPPHLAARILAPLGTPERTS
jgi:hypothetical protein